MIVYTTIDKFYFSGAPPSAGSSSTSTVLLAVLLPLLAVMVGVALFFYLNKLYCFKQDDNHVRNDEELDTMMRNEGTNV